MQTAGHFLSAANRRNQRLFIGILITSLMALIPFWLQPLQASHDYSLQWQAGYDFVRHGTLCHQTVGWPREIIEKKGGYDKQWMTNWPPAFSWLIGLGVFLGQPVLLVKVVFSFLFILGWMLWLGTVIKISEGVSEVKNSNFTKILSSVFIFLPLVPGGSVARFVYGQGMLPELHDAMVDWMVFSIFPIWYFSMRRLFEGHQNFWFFAVLGICIGLFYLKYSSFYLFLAAIFLISFQAAEFNVRIKQTCVALLAFFMGISPILIKNFQQMSSIARGFSIHFTGGLVLKNFPFFIHELIFSGFYHLLKASGLGCLIYLTGIEFPILHRLGRLTFLAISIWVGGILIKNYRAKQTGVDLKIQGTVLICAVIFLSYLVLVTGNVKTAVNPMNYLSEYRYFLPIVPFVFLRFWRGLLSFYPRLRFFLVAGMALNVVVALGCDFQKTCFFLKEGRIGEEMNALYTREEYDLQKANFDAVHRLQELYPNRGVVSFRYEIDKGFDRFGFLWGYELRKEIQGCRFHTNKPITILLVYPQKDSSKWEVAPEIDPSKYFYLKGFSPAFGHKFLYRLVEPGFFEI